MTDTNVADLLGDPRQIAVERAISEFRAARPVVIREGNDRLIAFPVEGLNERLLRAYRAQHGDNFRILANAALDNADDAACAVNLTPLTADTLASFIRGKHHSQNGHSAAFAVTSVPADDLDEAALSLSALAFLLPAIAVLNLDTAESDPENVLAIDASWIASYRDREAASIRIVSRAAVPLEGADNCEFIVFRGGDGFRDQVAVVVGNPSLRQPVLVRIHSACLTGDLFGSLKCDCGEQLRGTVRIMAEQGGGIVLYLDQEGRGNGIANKIRAYRLQADGLDTYDADRMLGFGLDQRRFDFAAAMLKQLGFHSIKLMTNNPQKIEALRHAGLDVVSTHRVWAHPTAHNVKYLAAKRDKAGHLMGETALDGADFGETPSLTASRT